MLPKRRWAGPFWVEPFWVGLAPLLSPLAAAARLARDIADKRRLLAATGQGR